MSVQHSPTRVGQFFKQVARYSCLKGGKHTRLVAMSYVILITMPEIIQIVLYSLASGATVIFGGFLAKLKILPKHELGREISHGIIAFGGGVLVAAVAFVLAPKGL